MVHQVRAKAVRLVTDAPKGRSVLLGTIPARSKPRSSELTSPKSSTAANSRQRVCTCLALIYGALIGTTGLLVTVPELRQALSAGKLALASQIQLFLKTPGLDPPPGAAEAPPSSNGMALGAQAKSQNTQKLKINDPIELDSLTKKEIATLRAMYVSQHKDLLQNPYQPYKRIYRDIQDGLPWIGLRGLTCEHDPEKRMYGLSAESTSLNNPFLIAEATFAQVPNFDYLVGNPDHIKGFPYSCLPENLTWNAQQARMDVTYNLSEYVKNIQKANNGAIIGVSISEFSTISVRAINAYDMGYTHIAATVIDDAGQSHSILPAPAKIHEVWRGISLKGGSTNIFNRYSGLQYFEAGPGNTVKVSLWKNEPTSPAQPADATAYIHIR